MREERAQIHIKNLINVWQTKTPQIVLSAS